MLGVLLAYRGADALVRSWPFDPRMLRGAPLEIDVHPDLQVLIFTAGLALLTGVLFGLAPAWNAFVPATSSSLRESGAAAESKGRRRFGQSLVVAQVALSLVLLSAAAVFARHVSSLKWDLGFERDSVLLVTLDPSRSGYQREQLPRLYQDLLERLHTIPGVRSATLSALTPIARGGASRFATVEGFDERPEDRRYLSLNWVGPKYFETTGTPIVAGRDFEIQDGTRPRVAIVNRAMARHYFGDGTAVGQHLSFDGQTQKSRSSAWSATPSTTTFAPPRRAWCTCTRSRRRAAVSRSSRCGPTGRRRGSWTRCAAPCATCSRPFPSRR